MKWNHFGAVVLGSPWCPFIGPRFRRGLCRWVLCHPPRFPADTHSCPPDHAMTERRAYRYYDLVMVTFVTVLVCSNLIGPAKIAQLDLPLVGVLTFGAGGLVF